MRPVEVTTPLSLSKKTPLGLFWERWRREGIGRGQAAGRLQGVEEDTDNCGTVTKTKTEKKNQ